MRLLLTILRFPVLALLFACLALTALLTLLVKAIEAPIEAAADGLVRADDALRRRIRLDL